MRTSWKRVSDEKIFAAERLCPVNEYVTKERTEASAGIEAAKALKAALIIRRVRMFLKNNYQPNPNKTRSRTPSHFFDIRTHASGMELPRKRT
jgi:hypothetical protein